MKFFPYISYKCDRRIFRTEFVHPEITVDEIKKIFVPDMREFPDTKSCSNMIFTEQLFFEPNWFSCWICYTFEQNHLQKCATFFHPSWEIKTLKDALSYMNYFFNIPPIIVATDPILTIKFLREINLT